MDDNPRDDLQPVAEADRVAAWLRHHPDFLAANPALYGALAPPRRVHGAALADHMAAMLEAARRRAELAEHAAATAAADRRAAEGFLRRVHDAALGLMRASDGVWFAAHDVAGMLGLDAARLCCEPPLAFHAVARVPRGTVSAALGQRIAIVRPAQPDALLHGEAVALAAQEALVRIPLAGAPALLALASRDPSGLAGATTDSLAFLGHVIGAALERV